MEFLGAFYLNNGIGVLVNYDEQEESLLKNFDFKYKRRELKINFLLENGNVVLVFDDLFSVPLDVSLAEYLFENNRIYVYFLNREKEIAAKQLYEFEIDKKFVAKIEGILKLIENNLMLENVEENFTQMLKSFI